MEMFSQNLENEKNLVCVLGRAERMPRETATATHLGRMRALGSSSPALRLPNQKQGVRDYLPWGSSQPTRLFKWVEGWWDLSFNCYDMTYVTPSFIIHFHLKRITGQIFTWDTFFNCQYFNIFTKCTLWNVWISFCFVLVERAREHKTAGNERCWQQPASVHSASCFTARRGLPGTRSCYYFQIFGEIPPLPHSKLNQRTKHLLK